ncbi:MAG: hypothetical protein KDA99_17310 [Planctomycetales bacterium]|nr:hypothetical protein [Planctomycetales bacterium]
MRLYRCGICIVFATVAANLCSMREVAAQDGNPSPWIVKQVEVYREMFDVRISRSPV